MSYCEQSDNLLICDSCHWTVEIFKTSANINIDRTVELDQWLSNPTSVQVDKKTGMIMIGCDSEAGVGVFDKDFRFVKKFAENVKMDFDYIAIDYETENVCMVYMCSTNRGKLTKWDYNTGMLVKEVSFTVPSNIQVQGDRVFLIIVEDVTECVAILDKHSLEISSRITVAGWSSLGGLLIDNSSNIIVTANKRVGDSVQRSVFVFDCSGSVKNEVALWAVADENIYILDMIAINSDLMVLTQEPDAEFFLKRIVFE